MGRPISIWTAMVVALLIHLAAGAVWILLPPELLAAPLVKLPPRPKPKPMRFRFVDDAETPPPERAPSKDAPVSDRDRVASGGEPAPKPRENLQPRTEGETSEMKIARRIPTPQRRPQPPRPPVERRPPVEERRPQPPERQTPGETERRQEQTLEQKRKELLAELAELEGGDLFEPRYDNPEGDFFQPRDTDAAIAFETQGVDWGPYARRLHQIVKRNWIIPPAAQVGTKGVVRIRFEITKAGRIQNMEILGESGTVSLDQAAWSAIASSDPLPPPPLPEGDEFVGVRFGFYYNVRLPRY